MHFFFNWKQKRNHLFIWPLKNLNTFVPDAFNTVSRVGTLRKLLQSMFYNTKEAYRFFC